MCRVQRNGLAWLFRLLTEPCRLWRRYLINNPLFVTLVLRQAVGLRKYLLDSQELRRAPHWMMDNGLEWLGSAHHRTPQPVLRRTERPKPKGLWWRYLIGNLLFLWRVLEQRLALRRTERPKSKGLGLLDH